MPTTVKKPQQARSRDTERRLLAAATAILEREGLAGLSVARVVREAKSSVGSFYARFADKDDLLRAVHRERMGQLLTRLRAMHESGACDGIAGPQLVATCAREMVGHYEQHPELMATFHSRSAADPAGWGDAVRDHLELADIVVELLLQGRWQRTRRDLKPALGLAVSMVFSFLGDLAVHGRAVPDSLPFERAALVPEITHLVTRYVAAPRPRSPRGKR